MSSLTIYVEGGGGSRGRQSSLRMGMSQFLDALRIAVRARRWQWSVVPSGGRHETFAAFLNARRHRLAGEIVLLLVDSEEPVGTRSRVEHLSRREADGWELAGVEESELQLMIQTMETWIIADPEALAHYYGQGFQGSALPNHANIEAARKTDVADRLAQATKGSKKGAYHKLKHASELLRTIDPQKVRKRCASCERMFEEVGAMIAAG